MSSPLDRIEAKEPRGFAKLGGWFVLLTTEERDALVAVARAAEELLVPFADEEREHGFPFNFQLRDAHRALREALSRLGKDTAA